MADKVWIPEVSNEVIDSLVARIRVIVERKGNKYFIEHDYIRTCDGFFYDPNLDKPVDQSELRLIREITTYHPVYSQYMFQPAFVDVLAQIPEELRDQVDAIELVDYPETQIQVSRNLKEFEAGYYVATTRLYSKVS